MSLKSKLGLYERNKTIQPAEAVPAQKSIASALGAEELPVGGRTVWRIKSAVLLNDLASPGGGTGGGGISFFLFPREVESLNWEELLFFDLETTSLSTGTGTYPFLICIGYCADDLFVTEQYFMEEYSQEPAILEHLLPFFCGAGALVSYNGSSFDLPLLKNRYRMNRIPGFPVNVPMIDLLHHSRRLYRGLCENCTLKTMEETLAGKRREDDIPGWLIPEVYFSFQRRGEWERLPDVVRHNREDVCSLIQVMLHVNGTYGRVEAGSLDTVSAEVLENLSGYLYRRAPDYFLNVVRKERKLLENRSVYKRFGSLLKRRGLFDEARDLWSGEESLYSLEELAKQAEHRDKDSQQALTYCLRAMTLIEKGVFSDSGMEMKLPMADMQRERFEKRMNRLNRNIQVQGIEK